MLSIWDSYLFSGENMIKVDLVGINNNLKKIINNSKKYSENYYSYYMNVESSSDYWVGKYATKFYDFQLENKIINKKTIDNIKLFIDLMNLTFDKYSKVAKKNIKIELNKKDKIERKYGTINSYINDAIGELESVININVNAAISKASNASSSLEKSKERTLKIFDKVSDYEELLKQHIDNMDIHSIVPLDISPYMVR